jgi:hypothetical protein
MEALYFSKIILLFANVKPLSANKNLTNIGQNIKINIIIKQGENL